MTTQEFAVLRTQLQMSDDELAKRLGVRSQLIAKWGDGRIPIAERFEDALHAIQYGTRAESVLAASGLPHCSVADDVRARIASGAALTGAEVRSATRHVRRCPTCQARERYVIDHIGVRKTATRGNVMTRVVGQTLSYADLLPEWARPAALGAALLFGIVAVRIVIPLLFILVLGPHRLIGALQLLGVPFMASLGGAAGGFGYSFLGRPLRSVPVAGPYLAGVVTVCAYMAALEWVFERLAVPMITATSDLVIFLGGSVFFGLVMGRMWFRADETAVTQRAAV